MAAVVEAVDELVDEAAEDGAAVTAEDGVDEAADDGAAVAARNAVPCSRCLLCLASGRRRHRGVPLNHTNKKIKRTKTSKHQTFERKILSQYSTDSNEI